MRRLGAETRFLASGASFRAWNRSPEPRRGAPEPRRSSGGGRRGSLLTQLTHVAEPAEAVSVEEQEAALEAAEAAMWGWYLEWSKIARIAIKQRPLLRQLGFLSVRRGSEEEETEEPAPSATTSSATPSPTSSPGAGAAAN